MPHHETPAVRRRGASSCAGRSSATARPSATAHIVTDDLDTGPIIAQGILPVTHAHTAADMAQAGRDVEKTVLARGLRLLLEERVFLRDNRAVVFEGLAPPPRALRRYLSRDHVRASRLPRAAGFPFRRDGWNPTGSSTTSR